MRHTAQLTGGSTHPSLVSAIPRLFHASHFGRSLEVESPQSFASDLQCRRGDLNPHALAGTSPSSWRVCLFRHSDGRTTEIRRLEIVARHTGPTSEVWSGVLTHRNPDLPHRPHQPGPVRTSYCPGSDGVVLLVDCGTRTAQYWANQSNALLMGVGVIPPMVRLHASAVGSANKRQRHHLVPEQRVRLLVVTRRRVRVQLLRGLLHQLVELRCSRSPSNPPSRPSPATRAAGCTRPASGSGTA